MHLIQSNFEDITTNDVVDWIRFLDTSGNCVALLNNNTIIESITYRISNGLEDNFILRTNQHLYKSSDIMGYWYRRGLFSFTQGNINSDKKGLKILSSKLLSNRHREQSKLLDSVYHFLHQNRDCNLNTFKENFINKIKNLSEAKDAGLNVPDTLVTNDIAMLSLFANQHQLIVTKDIEFDNILVDYDENYTVEIKPSVQLLTAKDIELKKEKMPTQFVLGYALYQQYISKRVELRSFYLKGKFYTMAIFSQENERTKVDYRNYDNQVPNRCVPYQLPSHIENKLEHFMKKINLNCGSIDIIYTPEKDYVFLEVNPIGQFQWLAKSCNYDIERQIAKQLTNK